MRLFTQKKKKKYADLYKEDKAAYPQKTEKKKKKTKPKTQTVVPDQDSEWIWKTEKHGLKI